jgi:hypothetical protein
LGLGPKYVGHYAYNMHCAPPTIRVHPNEIPSATTAFITGGWTFDRVVEGWQKQGATMGVYDYLSVVDWDWNLPRGGGGSRPSRIADLLTSIHGKGVRFYDAESGDCWGPCGLGYYIASRILWDINEAKNVQALTDDFLAKAFGSAKEPMREFYRLITEDTQRRSSSDLVGRMYRQLDAARKATTDQAVLNRIDDLILYTRHVELYTSMANGKGASKEDVVKHAYRIRKTEMVHAYGLWSTMIGQQAALTPNHPLKNETPYTAEEITAFLTQGIANNQPVEPGFEGVEFSKTLVPADQLALKSGAPGNFANEAQDRQRYFIWVPEGQSSVELKITVQKVWELRQPKVELYSPLEVFNKPVAVDESYKPDGKTNAITLKTPYTGLHRVETYDGGDFTRIEWPEGLAVTVESGPDTETAGTMFRGPWTLYFYVPKGTKVIGGWASRIANWAPRPSGTLVDPDGKTVYDFGKVEEGFFKIDVPTGQDGKVWKFENSQGQRLLMTVPPYLARSAGELLLPKEVVEKDGK